MTKSKYLLKGREYYVLPSDENALWESNWIVYAKDDNEEMGTVSFAGPKERGCVPFQIELKERFRNRGFGTDIIRTMMSWAFLHKNVYEVTCVIEHENDKAIKSFQKAGFVYRDSDSNHVETYTIVKEPSSWMGVYAVIGILVGLALGIILASPWIGMGIGMVVCLSIGASMDVNEKKDREEVTGKRLKTKKKSNTRQ